MKTKFKYLLGAALCLLMTLTTATAQISDRVVFDIPVTVEDTSKKGKPSYWTEWWVASMNSDGTDVVPLSRGQVPAWSPDGQFISFHGLDGLALAVMDAAGVENGGRAFIVATDVQQTGSDWSPDGTRLCFSGYSTQGLWIVDVNPLTEEVGTPIQVATGWCGYPSWSPDGTRIAYTVAPAGSQYNVVLDLETGAQTAFDVGGAHPNWSPDGSRIAFDATVSETITRRNKTTTNYYLEIFVANADGTGVTQVTNFKGTTGLPAWSPDGKSLIFMRHINDTRSIYRMDLGTGSTTFLHEGRKADWAH